MKLRSTAAAVLTALFSVGAVFANANSASSAKTSTAVNSDPAAAISPRTAEMKNILVKLVRQDEYLEETIDTLDAANGKLSIHDISALSLSLKMIKKNLDAVSAMNKKQVAEVQPDPSLTTYTKTILSYSRQVSQKALKVGDLVAQVAGRNKRSAVRDAVSSKSGGKARNGRKLTQIMEEQKAIEKLSAEAGSLKTSSRKLTATSKWLYIVSK